MDGSFFSDLLASIAERGRSVLKLTAWPRDADNAAGSLVEMCSALLTGRGEASGVALASEILVRYRDLSDADKGAFFRALADDFGPDRRRVEDAVSRFVATGGGSAASEIHYASEPRRQELFRRLNRAPGGTAALVAMRADLLDAMRGDRGLAIVDRDFQHLFGSWFNRGFLVLRRIDWSSPAAILEKIIRYEAVHEIRDWDELRRRIDPTDRRCYAFFHPALVDEPLIFVEVALTVDPPAAIAPLLAERRPHVGQNKARAATFYSISNCQQGLTSVTFGNFLIKQVVEEIRRELPRIETFVTLSPIPGLRAWVEACDDPGIDRLAKAVREAALDERWPVKPETAARLRMALEPLAAYYFLKARRDDGRVIDPVARFHLGNGARLERINWMGDLSPKGVGESYGLMVNYLYDLAEIERNHEAYANERAVVASSTVKRVLPSARSSRPSAAGAKGLSRVRTG
ncbi:MAG TPA: malonyl-CoA decarboxylase [Roseiarcus sp.]|nr:malonyl-CoA decarboxylase [Roseiarcus sp.]